MGKKPNIIDTLQLSEMQGKAKEFAKLTKELEHEDTPKHIQQVKLERLKNYKTLKTSKEKILFFYRYFLSSKKKNAQDNALQLAYAMTYLSENTKLVNEDDPLEIASYFELERSDALKKLLGKPVDYNGLIKPVDGEPFSDEYKLQCLIIAYCNEYGNEFGSSPYKVYPKTKNS